MDLLTQFFLFFSIFILCSKRKPRRRTDSFSKIANNVHAQQPKAVEGHLAAALAIPSSEPDPDDPKDTSTIENDGNKRTWALRLAKYAIPVQLAVVALLCAACLMEPHCCDGLNNYAWSMSPQLRYIRGPPPIWIQRHAFGEMPSISFICFNNLGGPSFYRALKRIIRSCYTHASHWIAITCDRKIVQRTFRSHRR